MSGVSAAVLENYAFLIGMDEIRDDEPIERVALLLNCSTRHAERVRQHYRRHGFDPGLVSDDIDPNCTCYRHDPTPSAYRKGCRCPGTSRAWTAYRSDYGRRVRSGEHTPRRVEPNTLANTEFTPAERAERRARRTAASRARAIVSRRRLQALARIGHTATAISAELGITPHYVHTLTGNRHSGGIRVKLHEAIAELYERWQYVSGPQTKAARQTAKLAHNHGYLPPAAWGPEIDDPGAEPTWPNRESRRSA